MSVITDDQVITILRAILLQGFTDQAVPFSIAVEQAYQPENDNADDETTIYIHKRAGANVGWPGTRYVFNVGNDNFDTVTTFQGRVTYQFSAFTQQDPYNEDYMSASNVLELALRIMQTPATVATLQLSSISMQRTMGSSQGYFDNDRQEFEQSPTFEIVLSYEQTIESTLPKVFPIDLSINRV